MNTSPLSRFSCLALLALLMVFLGGCATPTCPSNYAQHYQDTARHFSLCLPSGVTAAANPPAGQTVFTGFAVPAGTNLKSKTLVIAAGSYDYLQGATAAGSITADGVTFHRVKADEGSAGHSTLHVIYTGKLGGKSLHFDFTHRAVNVGLYDPSNRPTEYNQPAQIQISEAIMSTFKRSN